MYQQFVIYNNQGEEVCGQLYLDGIPTNSEQVRPGLDKSLFTCDLSPYRALNLEIVVENNTFSVGDMYNDNSKVVKVHGDNIETVLHGMVEYQGGVIRYIFEDGLLIDEKNEFSSATMWNRKENGLWVNEYKNKTHFAKRVHNEVNLLEADYNGAQVISEIGKVRLLENESATLRVVNCRKKSARS